jgi:SAM-dependent methyltransferase
MKEFDIRPRKLFNQYLELSRQDISLFFSDHSHFKKIKCPACGGEKQLPGLVKHGFKYVRCPDCSSLYLSPRPPAEMFASYYRQAKSVKFWQTHFYKETAEARRRRIYRPRAEIIAEWARRLGIKSGDDRLFVDIGSGYGIFLEEIERLGLFDRIMGIEPSPDLARKCQDRGFKVIQKHLEDVERQGYKATFATAFEVLEHVIDPLAFFAAAANILDSAGLLMLTTLTVSGFDIQVLWENSKSVCPPHHINLLSIDGLHRLVERSGMEFIQFSTPGKLDVDIVRNIHYENSDIKLPRFIHSIINSPEKVRTNFQNFLTQNELSSHVQMIVGLRNGSKRKKI